MRSILVTEFLIQNLSDFKQNQWQVGSIYKKHVYLGMPERNDSLKLI